MAPFIAGVLTWRLVDFFNETRRPAEGSYTLHE
jgi:hypothetical protein